MKVKKGNNKKLPRIITKQWKISKCLSIKSNSETYLLQETAKKENNILKTFHRRNFSKKKYKKVSCMADRYLLLPTKHYYVSGTHYLFYPERTTLKEILFQHGISLHELLSLGIDLTYAIEYLSEHHMFEADVSPNNIYLAEEGNFCLGDINLSSKPTRGTPGYIAPELFNEKFSISSKNRFDKAMQFSICKIIDSILQEGRKSPHENEISLLLDKGMQTMPQCRFSSILELREALQKQRELLQNDNCYELFQIHEQNHILFRTETLPADSKQTSLLYLLLWGGLVLSGCLFLTTLYRNLHSGVLSPEQKGIYLARISDTKKPFCTDAPSNSPSEPAAIFPTDICCPSTKPSILSQTAQTNLPVHKNKTTELDIQKKGYVSLSPVLSLARYPEEIQILYGGDNRITDISSITRFPNIREIYFNNNCIRELSGISSMEHLEILVLSYNQLTFLPDISKLPSLKILDISSNPNYKDINSLKKLNRLSTLNITGTGISRKQYRMLCKKLKGCRIIY